MFTWLYRLGSPRTFYNVSQQLLPWFVVATIIGFAYGLVGALYLAPADYQQGDAFRIIYLHVPCAFLSLAVYGFMSFCALLSIVWKIKLADVMLKVSASLGAWFTFLALFTGSVWGKPMWGTWWIWDARLTAELVLLFLYLGIIALRHAIPEREAAAKAVAIFVLVGFVDVPLIHYSVNWWNTLHQGPTLSKLAMPSIAPGMLYPLLAMIGAFFCYFIVVVLIRSRTEVLRNEQNTRWVNELLIEKGLS